jgi:glycosyltransferase involved in cell wall biosynthesis
LNEKVSVLIASYNQEAFLLEAIMSIVNQSYENWEIILVDDASTDRSMEIIKKILPHPRIKIIQNKINMGKAKSMNKGLELIESKYCLELDGDDWIPENALEIFVEEASRLPEDIALITGNVVHVFENKKGEQELKFVNTIRTNGRSFNERLDIITANYTPYPRFYRTDAVRVVGGWPVDDPYEGRYVNDLNLFLKLIERYRFHWIDQTLYFYRLHSHNTTTNNKRKLRKVFKYIIKNALKRWGDEYTPVFFEEKGVRMVKGLKRKTKRDEFVNDNKIK